MPEHQRLVKLVVMPIMGRFSEDGDLLGEEQMPGEVLYYPYQIEPLLKRLEQTASLDQRPRRGL